VICPVMMYIAKKIPGALQHEDVLGPVPK